MLLVRLEMILYFCIFVAASEARPGPALPAAGSSCCYDEQNEHYSPQPPTPMHEHFWVGE